MATRYEWDVEEYDGEDIVDHDHCELSAVSFAEIDGVTYQLVLVRDVGDDDRGLVDRSWAYAEKDVSGKWVLPREFDNGTKVPQRYHAALAKAQSA